MNGDNEGEIVDPSLFSLAIAKISVAQICQSIGFTGVQCSALEALSNITTRYLQTLAKSASSNANSSGRTECNLFDVIHAIEFMNSMQGFRGSSDLNRSVLNSGILSEIMNFVRSVDEIPFAKPIPRRNSAKKPDFLHRSITMRSDQDQDQDGFFPPHIPRWLPVLPDPSTYKSVEIRVYERDQSKTEEEEEEGNKVFNRATPGKGIDLKDAEGKRDLPDKRPIVKFKLGLGFRVEAGLRNGISKERNNKRDCWQNQVNDKEVVCYKRRRR